MRVSTLLIMADRLTDEPRLEWTDVRMNRQSLLRLVKSPESATKNQGRIHGVRMGRGDDVEGQSGILSGAATRNTR